MFAIGNDEIEKLPPLPKMITCPHCGKRHRIRSMGSISAYKCEKTSFMAGIHGKDIMNMFGKKSAA